MTNDQIIETHIIKDNSGTYLLDSPMVDKMAVVAADYCIEENVLPSAALAIVSYILSHVPEYIASSAEAVEHMAFYTLADAHARHMEANA